MTDVLLTGLKIGESARWHEGRLWLSNWGAKEVLAHGISTAFQLAVAFAALALAVALVVIQPRTATVEVPTISDT